MDFEGIEEGLGDGWRQFISIGEGPIVLNDNAHELCAEFIEGGSRLYQVVSGYDRALSSMAIRPSHRPGDTLRLILPFLRAYDVTDTMMLEFSRRNILTVPGASKTMRFVQEFMTPFMVATSYEHYITAACEAIGFPMENVYCTALEMDLIRIEPHEVEILKNTAREIARMSPPCTLDEACLTGDISPQDIETIHRLDEIFWEELTDLSAYALISDVNPLGEEGKASTILDIRRRSGIGLEDTCLIGCSTTDAQALHLVREGDGLTVAFNGDGHAIGEAQYALISESTVATSVLAEVFHKGGTEGVGDLADNWGMDWLRRPGLVSPYLLKEFERTFPTTMPVLARVMPENIDALIRQSRMLRKSLACEDIGSQV